MSAKVDAADDFADVPAAARALIRRSAVMAAAKDQIRRRRRSVANDPAIAVKCAKTNQHERRFTFPNHLIRASATASRAFGGFGIRLLELLGSGMSFEEILADYPDLERDDLLAALTFC